MTSKGSFRFAALFAASAGLACSFGCATTAAHKPSVKLAAKNAAKKTSLPKVRNLAVQNEIHEELNALETRRGPAALVPVLDEQENTTTNTFDSTSGHLLGPINDKRMAELASASLIERPTTDLQASAASELQRTNEAGIPALNEAPSTPAPIELKKLSSLETSSMQFSKSSETPLIFDIPVTYNKRVSRWIHYFQTNGRSSFKNYLERSSRYLPFLQYELSRSGLPQDLAYVAMVESGFQPSAVSHKGAMGLWQIITSTGQQYGLRVDWWVDERKDFEKSTHAAISYIRDLYSQFNSWYLVAASYNMGENGVRRLIKRHGTNNFWDLADRGALPTETRDYVPKIIAAMLISKAPALYGFRDLNYTIPLSFDYYRVPGGTDLVNLANFLGVSDKYLRELNPELTKGFIPRSVAGHNIRIPKGATLNVAQYVRLQAGDSSHAANY